MSLEFTKNRLQNSDVRVDKFIDENIISWSEDEILQLAQKDGFSRGLSDAVLGTMSIVKRGFMKAAIRWELRTSDGKPLHKFLEKGTDPHTIEALGKLFGGADSLMWRDSSGRPIFRRKVNHPGTEGMFIIENAWRIGKPKLKKRIIMETNNFLEVNRL